MTHARRSVAACCLAALAVMLAGPVTGAGASEAGIKAAIRAYSGKIDVAEGHVLTAVGEYKTTHNAAPVEEAITASISVLSALRTKIVHQSVAIPKIRTAKSKLVKGLGAVITAYEKLKAAYSDKASSPTTAQSEAEKAIVALKSGSKQLKEAIKILR